MKKEHKEKELEKEMVQLIEDLKIFVPKEDYFLFKGRIGKIIDKGFQEGKQEGFNLGMEQGLALVKQERARCLKERLFLLEWICKMTKDIHIKTNLEVEIIKIKRELKKKSKNEKSQ